MTNTKMTTHTLFAIALLAFTAFSVGCKPSAKQGATETRGATGEQLDKVNKEGTQVAQAMKDYTYAEKAEFVASMQDQLNAINRSLDQLAAKIEGSSEAAKAEVKPKLQALRDRAAQLTQRLKEAEEATESTWGEVKAGFQKRYNELKDGFQEARLWLSDKIAP